MALMTRAAKLGVAVLMGHCLSAPLVQANYIINLTEQSGVGVVANGSGTLDVTDLNFLNVVSSTGVFIDGGAGIPDRHQEDSTLTATWARLHHYQLSELVAPFSTPRVVPEV